MAIRLEYIRSRFASYINELLDKGVLAEDDLERFQTTLDTTNKMTVESLISKRKAATRSSARIARQDLEELINDPDLQRSRTWMKEFITQVLEARKKYRGERHDTSKEAKWVHHVDELVSHAQSIGARSVLFQSGSDVHSNLIASLREHDLLVAKEVGSGRSKYQLLTAPEDLFVKGEGEVVIPQFLVAWISSDEVLHWEPGTGSVELQFAQLALGLDYSRPDGRGRSHVRMQLAGGTGVRVRLTASAPTFEVLMKQHTIASLLVAAIFSAIWVDFGVVVGLILRHESLLYFGLVTALIGFPTVYVVVHRDLHADPNIRKLPPANTPPSQLQYDLEADKYIFEQERARVAAYISGIATAAAGFIATLIVALLKGEVSRTISPWWPAGALIGAVVLVGYATFLSLTLRPLNDRFSARHPQ